MQGDTRQQYQDLRTCTRIVGDIAKQSRSLEDGLEEILRITCRRIGASEVRGTLLFTTANDQTIVFSCQQDRIQRESNSPAIERGLTSLAKSQHDMVIASNLKSHPPAGYIQYWPAVQSEIAVPLLIGGECFGVFDVGSSHNNAFSDGDQIWLQQVATIIELMIPPQWRPADRDVTAMLDELLQTALVTSRLTDAYAVLILADGDRVVPKWAAMRQGGQIFPTQPLGEEWGLRAGLTGRALRTGQPVLVPNVEQDPDYLKHLLEVKSELVIPIRQGSQQEIIGALDIQAFTLDAFPSTVVAELVSLAQQVSSALNVAQLSYRLDREQKILERLAKVAPAFVRKFSLDRVYDLVLEAAFSLLPTAHAAHILTVKKHAQTGEQSLVMVHRLPAPEDRSENRPPRDGRCALPLLEFHADRGITGRAVRTQQTQYVPDIRNDPDHIVFSATTRSEIAIPVLMGHSVIAVLNIESEAADGFSAKDQVVAELLAAEAGLAISNAQDYARKIELLNIVVKATREVLSSVDDSQRLIGAILAGAMRVCNAEDGYCALILKDGERLWVKQEAGEGAQKLADRKLEWTISDGLTGRAIREKRPIYVADTSLDPTYISTTGTMLTDLAVPLFDSENEPVGVITLESPALDAFDEQAVEALQLFGPPVVAALIKGDLVNTLRQQQQETIDLIRQVAHLLSKPAETLQEELKKWQASSLSQPIQDVEAATAFLRLVLEWLAAQADVLGQTNEQKSHKPVDIRNLVARVLSIYRYYADKKHVTLTDTSQDEAIEAHVSREELLGAIVELVVNAVKYSPKGGTVSVRTTRILREIRITIEDEGRGVPREDLEKVFSRSVRGSNVGSDTKGSGLGLYFVRQAIERQGGTVWVESPCSTSNGTPHGSRFIIRLPVVE